MSGIRHSDFATRKRGFTLIELMVATGIMTLLVLAVMTMTGRVLDIWGTASGRLTSNAEARTALQYLGDDLETLVVRPKSQVWLQVREEDISTVSDAAKDTVVGVPSISLITATEHRDRSAGDFGNICAVNYQLAFRNPIDSNATGVTPPRIMGLYRKVMNPNDTFTTVLANPFTSQPSPTNTLEQLMGTTSASKNTVATFENFLSANVVDLKVDFYAENLDDPTKVLKVPGSFIYADRLYDGNGVEITQLDNGSGTNQAVGSLVYADIRMTVLSDEGAKALSAAGLTGRDLEDIIRSHGSVFTRRVPIMSRH